MVRAADLNCGGGGFVCTFFGWSCQLFNPWHDRQSKVNSKTSHGINLKLLIFSL